jgi:hypothetical protein
VVLFRGNVGYIFYLPNMEKISSLIRGEYIFYAKGHHILSSLKRGEYLFHANGHNHFYISQWGDNVFEPQVHHIYTSQRGYIYIHGNYLFSGQIFKGPNGAINGSFPHM